MNKKYMALVLLALGATQVYSADFSQEAEAAWMLGNINETDIFAKEQAYTEEYNPSFENSMKMYLGPQAHQYINKRFDIKILKPIKEEKEPQSRIKKSKNLLHKTTKSVRFAPTAGKKIDTKIKRTCRLMCGKTFNRSTEARRHERENCKNRSTIKK
jgi:hypothetical protein